jgi:hypothetical protein
VAWETAAWGAEAAASWAILQTAAVASWEAVVVSLETAWEVPK